MPRWSDSEPATQSPASIVWDATNLVDWLNVGTATESQPGIYEFIDTTTTNWPQRFYRISAP
jgi:hypothetical protein